MGRLGWGTCATTAAALALAGASGGTASPPAWSSYGNGPERSSATGATPVMIGRRFVLPLRGRITSQVLAADGDFFAATSAGEVAAFTPDGYVRWKVELGQLAHSCPQLDGSNAGDAFTESAGYGEHLVRLSPGLAVQAASHPDDLEAPLDLDFAGSPLVVERPGCGELVVGADKDDDVYAWRGNAVGDGPIWKATLEPFDADDETAS